MDEKYDYPYCASYSFDEDGAYVVYNSFSLDADKERLSFDDINILPASILYDAFTGSICWRGFGDDNAYKKHQVEDKKLVYVQNVFTELHNLFSKEMMDLHHFIVSKEIIHILQNSFKFRRDSFAKYRFLVTVPTYWDSNIQEEKLRPLFIRAGLIDRKDHDTRLIFVTQLTSNFRYIFHDNSRSDLVRDKQYIMCSYKIADEVLIVDLDLFTARSSSPLVKLRLYNDDFIPSQTNSVHFTIPLVSSLESGMKACAGSIIAKTKPGEIDQLKKLLKRYQSHKLTSNSETYDFRNLGTHRLFRQYLSPKRWELFEVEISRLQSVSLKDIHGQMFDSIKAVFSQQLMALLRSNYGKSRTAILVSRNTQKTDNDSFVYDVLFDWIQEMLREFGEYPFNYTLMNIEGDVVRMVNAANAMEGSVIGMKQNMTPQLRNPVGSDIPTEISYDSSTALFMDGKSFYTVNIEISLDVIESTFSLIGKNRFVQYSSIFDGYDIQPPGYFFPLLNGYQRPLHISHEMKMLLDTVLEDHASNIPTNNDFGMIKDGSFLKALLNDIKVSKSLSISEARDDFASNRIVLYHKKYKIIFLAIYLGYLSKLVMDKLDKEFEENWKDKDVVYLISVEKLLLDITVGHKKELQKLLVKMDFCDMGKKSDMMRVITQGERSLFAAKPKLREYIRPNQYFIMAQLYQSSVHLALHQIVKASSSDVPKSSIILTNNTVIFDNVLDVLYKRLWIFIFDYSDFGFCDFHAYKKSCSLKEYQTVFSLLKQSVQNMFRQVKPILDMDSKIHIPLSELCSCEIQVCLRDVIDIGLRPIIQDIAVIITGAVQNNTLFKDYPVEFILVTGNMFTLMYNSPLYGVYTCMLQSEIEHSLKTKKIDTTWLHILQKSQQQASHERSYIYDKFTTGDLQRVFSETYILYIRTFNNGYGKQAPKPFLSFVDKSFRKAKFGGDENTAIVIFKAGHPISDNDIIITLKVEPQNENDYDPSYGFILTLARLNHRESIEDKEVISLEEGSYVYEDTELTFYGNYDEPLIQFKTKFIPRDSSIQVYSLNM